MIARKASPVLGTMLVVAACSNPSQRVDRPVAPAMGAAQIQAQVDHREAAATGRREDEAIPTPLSSAEIWERFLTVAQSRDLDPAAVGYIFGIPEQPLQPDPEFRSLRLERHSAPVAPAFNYRLLRCLPPSVSPRAHLCPGGRPALFLAILGPFYGTGGAAGSNCLRNVDVIQRLQAAGWTLVEQHVPTPIPHSMLAHLVPDRLTRPGREISILRPTYAERGCVAWVSLTQADQNDVAR